MGYFGYAYYVENKDKLKAVKVDAGKGAVEPTDETIQNGEYAPLSRPIFIYASKQAMEKEHIKQFMEFYLTEGKELVSDVGYIKMSDEKYGEGLKKLGIE